ncbi:MAG: type II toxin-antitoxin system HicB family antitoxin [Roseiflexus sp.]|nr:type II toxin-antitoxin system HicB family antitoxin [Roseiflexus sp.]MDW8146482.1 type II toxin-antitoxin system HicB family antitoxin [Roseiflexaceae bacterium]MDW8234677.1 type II toxin-antitoxin system HicB family antitoxin [Roseiflexaceae bacterium]
MLIAYIQAAMDRARYELLDDQPDTPYYGEIPECPGVWATGATLEECRAELQQVLEGWLILGLQHGHALPVLNGIDLNRATLPLEAA